MRVSRTATREGGDQELHLYVIYISDEQIVFD